MLNLFRTISILEGISYLLILAVSFSLLSPDYVFYLGMGHGVLFMLYIICSLALAQKQKWSLLIWFPIFLASIVPLAFVLVELFLKKRLKSFSASLEE